MPADRRRGHAGAVTELPMFPLGSVLLPGGDLSLRIFESRYRVMIAQILAGDGRFGVVLIERGSEVGGGEVRTNVGTVAQVRGHVRHPDGQYTLACRGTERIRVARWLDDDPFPRAVVEPWPDLPQGPVDPQPLLRAQDRLEELIGELARRQGGRLLPPPSLTLPADPTELSYLLARELPITEADRHHALTAPGPADRMLLLERAVDDVIASLQFRLQ